RETGDRSRQFAAIEAGRRPPDLSLALELGAQPPAVDPRRGRVVGPVGEGHGVVDQTPGAGRWRGEGATVGARPGAQDLVVAAGALVRAPRDVACLRPGRALRVHTGGSVGRARERVS